MLKRKVLFATLTSACLAGAASGALTSQSYVTRGLVASYDAIDNAGVGVHNSASAVWKDLTGNGYDGAMASTIRWTDNAWTNGVDGKPITLGTAFAPVLATGTFTIQFACTPIDTTSRKVFFGQYQGGAQPADVNIEQNNSVRNDGVLRLYRNNTASGGFGKNLIDNYDWLTTCTVAGGQWISASYSVTPTFVDLWINGTTHESKSASFGAGNGTAPCVIGGEPSRASMAFRGAYNAFRLYDRALTEAEAKVNAAIDAIRYNGANAGDFTLEGGYAFDANGDLTITMSAEAADGGTVSVGGGTPAATASVTMAQHAGTPTVFAATPPAGYVFAKWTGDVEAISSGTIYDASVTVSATYPVVLKATFRRKGELTAQSYVRWGLAACYDGIENAGYGTHDANATKWKDLSGHGLDGICAQQLTWGANGWSVNTNCKPVTVGAGLAQVLSQCNFTIEFACTPATVSKRLCYFGQYAVQGGINIENKVGGALRLYRNTNGSYPVYDQTFSTRTATFGTSVFTVVPERQVNWHNGTKGTTKSLAFGVPTSSTNCVIGCELQWGGHRASLDAVYGITFQGTYHAFRTYSRVLTDDEIKVNTAIDAIRFNGASASSYSLGGGYSFNADGDLMVTVSATAADGGTVSIDGGAAGASASVTVCQALQKNLVLTATPAEGYVFDKWVGETEAIVQGSIITPEITVAAVSVVNLRATFRKPGNALDGMLFDLDIKDDLNNDGLVSTGEAGNALKAGAADAATFYRSVATASSQYAVPSYLSADATLPYFPAATNAAQTSLYFPQQVIEGATATNVFRTLVTLENCVIEGPVVTLYARFRWDGPVLPNINNYPVWVNNGYAQWTESHLGQGLAMRLAHPAGYSKAYFSCLTPMHTATRNSSLDPYITAGKWVDCFYQQYPSPTDPAKCNVDVWFCQEPTWNTANGAFNSPTLQHVHFGDSDNLPAAVTSAARGNFIRLGSESGGSINATDGNAHKTFRGAIASVKGWNRLLTTNEMWSVMAGQHGGTWHVGVPNGTAEEFGADGATAEPFDPTADKWRTMKKSLTAADRTLTLAFPLRTEEVGLPRLLVLSPLFDGTGDACPVTVTANGMSVGTFDLAQENKRIVLIRRGLVRRDGNGKMTIAITRPEGCAGTLSFDALSLVGSWQVSPIDGSASGMTREGYGVTTVHVVNDPPARTQRALTNARPLTHIFDMPAETLGRYPYVYRTKIIDHKAGNVQPARLELNGVTVWSSENIAKGEDVTVTFEATAFKPGLNELIWYYEPTAPASNWLTFDYHSLVFDPPPNGATFIVR